MTFKENVRAILDCNLTEIKDEIKDLITEKIGDLREVYPSNFVSDLDEVKGWYICGYRVEDLVKFALILKDKRVDDYDLRDYNACFFDGYKRATEDINKQLEESINNMFKKEEV